MIEPLSKQTVRYKRRVLMRDAVKKIRVSKNDGRIKGYRCCSVCGKSLTRIIGTTGKTRVLHNHMRCKYNSFIQINLCETAQKCYAELRRKGVLKDDENVGHDETRLREEKENSG